MEDAVTLNHLVVREELVLARERTGLLVTEVGRSLGYATTSKRVLAPEEKSATTYRKKERTKSPTPKGGGRKNGTQCPFFAKGTCKFGDACRD